MAIFNIPEASDWIQQYYEDYFRNFMTEAEWKVLRDEFAYEWGKGNVGYVDWRPPEGVTYSPEAKAQRYNQLYEALNIWSRMIYNYAGVPDVPESNLNISNLMNPGGMYYSYWVNLPSETQQLIIATAGQVYEIDREMTYMAGIENLRDVRYPAWQAPPEPPPPFMPAWAWAEEVTGIKPGERIRAGQYKIPSGQMMKRMTPSEMAGLSGLINWAGGRGPGAYASAEDYWHKAMSMLPTTQPKGTVRWATSPYR